MIVNDKYQAIFDALFKGWENVNTSASTANADEHTAIKSYDRNPSSHFAWEHAEKIIRFMVECCNMYKTPEFIYRIHDLRYDEQSGFYMYYTRIYVKKGYDSVITPLPDIDDERVW